MTERNLARTVPTTSSVATRLLLSTTCACTVTAGRASPVVFAPGRPQPFKTSVASSNAPAVEI